MRVIQQWAGKTWGWQYIPRVGTEVAVAFMDGDVDRPVVVGGLYNAEYMPPFALPDQKTKSGLRTRSTLNGGTSNFSEFSIDDKMGQELVFLHCEKDHTIEAITYMAYRPAPAEQVPFWKKTWLIKVGDLVCGAGDYFQQQNFRGLGRFRVAQCLGDYRLDVLIAAKCQQRTAQAGLPVRVQRRLPEPLADQPGQFIGPACAPGVVDGGGVGRRCGNWVMRSWRS